MESGGFFKVEDKGLSRGKMSNIMTLSTIF